MSELVRHYIHNGRVYPYRCGAKDGAGSTALLHVTCTDCLDLMKTGGSDHRPPLHIPPQMNENEDGIFEFTDVHNSAGYTLEVVPQTTGNVEMVLVWPNPSGKEQAHLFTLSHLDRADLIRALLHDFHYSPERGGPHDDLNN